MTELDETLDNKFDLERFVSAQKDHYEAAISELRAGEKVTHWLWFIFPQLYELGKSEKAKRFGIRSLEEAKAYLDHPLLGERLRECSEELLKIQGKSAEQIMHHPDDAKLRSSMTLFSIAAGEGSIFRRVLNKYFEGKGDEKTTGILGVDLGF
jgi:uncharacterized protein (DUF1810 family)